MTTLVADTVAARRRRSDGCGGRTAREHEGTEEQ
jgi:hypothetical protein